ncbi:hypothetical protein MPER_07101 [Moniliophthora perniciosa FA553]|nr:hypothetical protein MPER_07101 [Moniliophthora perniciosa FA553]
MLVHDAKADEAADNLNVAGGHLSHPGTENFSKDNEYSECLAKNNGHANAYTSVSNTNYYFDAIMHLHAN